ncbi:JAB domain-containing protein [Thermaurantiacus sp.]
MTGAARGVADAGALGGAGPTGVPVGNSAGSRDRWLLMRLLSAVESVPRLADRLLAERGSLGAVLALSDERLRQLGADANGIAILGLVREAVSAVLSPEGPERPRIDCAAAVAKWLYASMAWLPVEEVRALFLDGGQRLIRAERLGTGSVRAAVVYPREVARRALELSAAAVILAHNHPSGDPTPSAEDRSISKRVAAALATIDVALLDHVVIARSGWASAMPAGPDPGAPRLSMIDMSTGRTCATIPQPA